ncbi:unnamed protein product [Caenorhabditis sp. 36 PRJEB53466]|nr:unnamed protein product [Caenorhabditis sp. 36 PRJEB53466]
MKDPDRLNRILQDQPYIEGFENPSAADFTAKSAISLSDLRGREHLERWFHHLDTFEMSAETAVLSTENLPQQILDFLGTADEFNSIQLAQKWSIDHQKLIGGIKSILTNDGVLATKDVSEKRFELTGEGIQMADEGSHEFRVYEFIGDDGVAQADVMKQPFGKIGVAKAMAAKWVQMDKSTGKVKRQAGEVVDTANDPHISKPDNPIGLKP